MRWAGAFCSVSPTKTSGLSRYSAQAESFGASGVRMSQSGQGQWPAPRPVNPAPADHGRRRFVLGTGSAMALATGLGLGGCGGGGDEGQERFGYGVASGDPLTDRVILWTRVNDVPGAVRSGMGSCHRRGRSPTSCAPARPRPMPGATTRSRSMSPDCSRARSTPTASAMAARCRRSGRTKTLAGGQPAAGAAGRFLLRRLFDRPVPRLCGRGQPRRLRCRGDAGRLHLRDRPQLRRAVRGRR